MIKLRHSLQIFIILGSASIALAQTQNQAKTFYNFSNKFSKYAEEFARTSKTLLEYEIGFKKTDLLFEIARLAREKEYQFYHIADLVKIYHMSNEYAVKSFARGSISRLKKTFDATQKASIEYLDILIKATTTQSTKEKTIEFRNDLIAAGAVLESL